MPSKSTSPPSPTTIPDHPPPPYEATESTTVSTTAGITQTLSPRSSTSTSDHGESSPLQEQQYHPTDPMTLTKKPAWEMDPAMRAQLEDQPGCCCSTRGGCCFSDTGGCCFSSNGGCCFSDRYGTFFSDRGGCCFGDRGSCC
ncbi:hypothetical protein C8A00DRAFT_37100 [Chaetomidium leptoderma]|uniref:Uncharacterized protein n=1 Tax=Chaetomidium leptoderma TaxID=669021 RepID=A0AAN6ZTG2_9PEZI|nr:hypothetical protein C8A00DRAFT_37100 [Chaetomidium leptoderma]